MNTRRVHSLIAACVLFCGVSAGARSAEDPAQGAVAPPISPVLPQPMPGAEPLASPSGPPAPVKAPDVISQPVPGPDAGPIAPEGGLFSGFAGNDYGGTSRFFAELAVGGYGSVNSSSGDFNFIPIDLRLGLRASGDDGWRGRCSVLLDLRYASITNGSGSSFWAPVGLLRYDLCNPCNKLVPYFQIGAGVAFLQDNNDPANFGHHSSGFLGEVDLGVRCRLSERCSVFAEFGYQHIGNAGEHGSDVNALGGNLGVQFSLGKGR
jgi:hypothetical protein